MLLPLDFLKTARMNPEFERDIEDSMLASYANLPKLPGKTLFIVDVSGSMSAPMSSKSDFTRYDAACAWLLHKMKMPIYLIYACRINRLTDRLIPTITVLLL